MAKNINIFEVAKLAGVSKSTVSRALNNDYGISPEAKEKVLAAVEALKYRPNISARYLRKNTNNLLGILISSEYAENEDAIHPINSIKITGIIKKAKELDYDVIIFVEDISDHSRLNNIIKEKGIAGIILMDILHNDVLESFRNYNVPFVLVNWIAKGYKPQCYVKTDLAKATIMALDLLTSKGFGDIGVINWEDSFMQEKIIENSFIEYMKSKNLNYEGCIFNCDFSVSEKEVEEFVASSKKRAYLSFSYSASMYIINYCSKNKILIPDELALISYEFFPFFDNLYPRLTGIKQQADKMGEKAVEKLVQKIKGVKNVRSELIEPEIIERDSC